MLIVPKIEEKPQAISPAYESKKKELLKRTAVVIGVDTEAENKIAIASRRDLKVLMSEADSSEEFYKKPFYIIYKWVIATVAAYKLELVNEESRLKKLTDNFAKRELEKQEAAQKLIDEAKERAEKAASDALAEQERIAKLARPQAKKEIDAEERVQQTQVDLRAAEVRIVKPVAKAAGQFIRRVIKFEITDAKALYAVRPEWFELIEKRQIINASIAKDTQLPGLKIWESIETGARI